MASNKTIDQVISSITRTLDEHIKNMWLTTAAVPHAPAQDIGFGNSGLLPIAIKVSSMTIGHELVSVQPLEMPKGMLTYLDFKYTENLFRIYYVTADGKDAVAEVVAASVDHATRLIEDFGSIKFHIDYGPAEI